MALTSNTDHLSPARNTPTVDTVTLIAIRRSIEPREGWWQFEIRPWHVITFFGSYVVVVIAGIAGFALTGALR